MSWPVSRRVVLAADDPWVRWGWVRDHLDEIGERLVEHVVLTGWAVALGFAVAVPLGIATHRRPAWRSLVVGVAGILYTVPALAAFAVLVPWTGLLSRTTALIPLVGYTLFLLLRNVLAGLDAVPAEVLDAADGLGYRRVGRLWRVELPLAVPALVAGLRLATVTTIGLVTVTALIGQGGLGQFFLDAIQRDFRTPLVVGAVCTVALAVGADLVFVVLQRVLAPWARRARP